MNNEQWTKEEVEDMMIKQFIEGNLIKEFVNQNRKM